MKAKILALLRERGAFVSGQEMCGHFGVSRTAVWKAIGQLKKEGYEIESVQNKGYRLIEEDAEDLSKVDLESRIKTKWAGKPVLFYKSIDSTNTAAKKLAEEGACEGSLVVADMQTAGRGRRGRAWVSPSGTNIYYTIILRPNIEPDRVSMLTLVMGLSVAEGMQEELSGKKEDIFIKWPNDVVTQGKKLVGILTELSAEQDYVHYVVIGVGINVREQEFAEEIRDRAISLDGAFDVRINRGRLLAAIMEKFEKNYELFMQTKDFSLIKSAYERLLVNKDNKVRVLDPREEYEGIERGITDRGELIVEKEDKTLINVYAGEVSVRGIYGYT